MHVLTNEIRRIARDLLKSKEVDLVIGFEQGTMHLRSTPCFVRDAADVDRLVWDDFCQNNLAAYVAKREGSTAIVAKGCDTRALVELIKENRISREQLVIIGVPCEGMVDSARIETELDHGAIREVFKENGELVVKGINSERRFNREAFLYESCKRCRQRNPVIYDKLVGSEVKTSGDDSFQDIEAFEDLPTEERWTYFSKEMDKCIRCYACRNACPLCYCQECFVDFSSPQWIGKSVDLSDTALFHLMRAFHLAGRCVECGACERACPIGVDIGKLNRKLCKDVQELFGYRAGTSLEEVAPLSTYRLDDPENFMFEL
jgi:formate dehydrogenase subunit beta